MRGCSPDDNIAVVHAYLDPLAIAKPDGLRNFAGDPDRQVFAPLSNDRF